MARVTCTPDDKPSLHMMQAREFSYFIIGQEATTTGRPTLNSANTTASVSPVILYLSENCMC